MSKNKITVPVPLPIVGLVRVDGMNITIASGHRLDTNVDNWLGLVIREHPDAQIILKPLSEVAELLKNDKKSNTTVENDTRVGEEAKVSSNLIKEATKIFEWAAAVNTSDIYIDVKNESGVGIIARKVNGLIDSEKLERRAQEMEEIMGVIYNVMGSGKEKGNWSKNEPAYASIRKKEYLPEGIHSIRIQTNVSDGGYGATLRLLPKKNEVEVTSLLKKLGYNPNIINHINMMLMRPKGGMLIIGGVGSGKSTTLQALLEILNHWYSGRKRIYTVEDPVEYPIDCAIQMGVTGAAAGMSSDEQYANAVKILLRSAPDVGMVGEIRGCGTAAEFFRIASSGFKGLSTLHGNGCWAGIKRLHEELNIPISYLSDLSIFSGCMTQQLLQTLCPECKVPLETALEDPAMKEDAQKIRRQLEAAFSVDGFAMSTIFLHREEGCPACNHRGFNGRTPIGEVVISDMKMWEDFAAKGGATGGGWAAAEDYWRNVQGGQTLLDDALVKVSKGIVDPLTVMREVGALNMTSALKDHSLSRTEIAEAVTMFDSKIING